MKTWEPSAEQLKSWEENGYLVVHNVVPRDVAIEMRGVIKNTIMSPEPHTSADADPMDPMNDDTPEARQARFRKLGKFCQESPLIWDNFHVSEQMLAIGRYFLGDDILVKFNSCFLKPPRSGSATPWHQDNGLWRDGQTEPFNFWMALDPATRANGCLQFIPGSHKTEIIPHVLYEDSIHGELPRERVQAMIDAHGLEHIELDSGDIVCWHSNLWHYSPPNTSDMGRIAIAGVYTSPGIVAQYPDNRHWDRFPWGLKNGERCYAFPQEWYEVPNSGGKIPQFQKADEMA